MNWCYDQEAWSYSDHESTGNVWEAEKEQMPQGQWEDKEILNPS